MIDNILNIDKNSEIFLTQEVQDEKYEILFGDGLFGRKLENNSVITVTYVVTEGETGNGASNFGFQDHSKVMELSSHPQIVYPSAPSQMPLMVLKLKIYRLLSILLQDFIQHNIEQLHLEIMKQ